MNHRTLNFAIAMMVVAFVLQLLSLIGKASAYWEAHCR